MALTEALQSDSNGKSFEGLLVDNSGINEFVPKSGSNRRTQNSEVVADENVNVTNHITGAMTWLANFTLNASGVEQTLTVSTSVVQFSALHADTTHVLITVSGGEVRFTLKGTNPTSTSGHRMFPHDAWIMEHNMAEAAKFILGYNATQDGKLFLTELIERALLTTT